MTRIPRKRLRATVVQTPYLQNKDRFGCVPYQIAQSIRSIAVSPSAFGDAQAGPRSAQYLGVQRALTRANSPESRNSRNANDFESAL
jgi:hypothetical protein